MTPTLFILLFAILTIVSGLITQALKKAYSNSIATNVLALIDALFTGVGGTVTAYILMGIPFTPINCLCIGLLTIAVWLGSMIGFDKVKQSIDQIIELKTDTESKDE
jgi:uncharacterized protein (DUF697 family)